MSFVNRQDSDRRKELIGAPAARWVQRGRRIWAIVVVPLALVLLVCLILVRVVGISATAFGPFIFVVVCLMLLSAFALPLVSIGMLRRASREAAKYVDSGRVMRAAQIPIGIVVARPVVIEQYLMRMGNLAHDETKRVVTFGPEPSARRGVALIFGTLRSRASGTEWSGLVASVAILSLGILVAVILAVLEIVRIATGAAASHSPDHGGPVLFVVAIVLIAVGALGMYGMLRRISDRRK